MKEEYMRVMDIINSVSQELTNRDDEYLQSLADQLQIANDAVYALMITDTRE